MIGININAELIEVIMEIQLKDTIVNYIFNKEEYRIGTITLLNSEVYEEPSAGYQEPKDQVIEETYQAHSEHGNFTWLVTARKEGFSTVFEIEVERTQQPEGCDGVEYPCFEMVEIQGFSS